VTFERLGNPLRELGKKPRAPASATARSRQVKMKPRYLDYAQIKEQVMEAIANLSALERAKIPMSGTLPEIMVALGLIWAKLPFEAQLSYAGGRLSLGGQVIDFKVAYGGTVIVRVMGDYWHTLPGRKQKDIIQWDRLHAYGYRVADLWEHDIYQAWRDGQLAQVVKKAVEGAQ
jgi:hypothetical protein